VDNKEDKAEPQDSRECQKDCPEARAVALHDFGAGSCMGDAQSLKWSALSSETIKNN